MTTGPQDKEGERQGERPLTRRGWKAAAAGSAASLSARIALHGSLCVALSILVVCSALGWRAWRDAEQAELALAQSLAEQTAGLVQRSLGETHAVVQSFARALTAQKQADLPIGRAQLDATLKAVIERAPQWLGFYSVWAPDALDGRDAEFAGKGPGTDASGRFLSWWNRLEGKIGVAPVAFLDQPGANDWYDVPCRTQRDTWLDVAPFEAQGTKVLASTMASPIVVNGRCLGIVAVDIELGALQRQLQAIELPIAQARVALLSQRGVYVSDPRTDWLGQAAKDLPTEVLARIHEGVAHRWIDPDGWMHLYTPVRIAEGLPAWTVEVRLPLEQTHRSAQALLRWAMAVGLVCVLVGSAVMLWLVTRMTAPLRRLADTLEALVSGTSRLDVALAVKGRDELSRIANAFNAFVGKLRLAFADVAGASAQVDVAASEIAGGNQDLSQRTESQAGQLHAVNSAVQSLAESIRASRDEAIAAAHGAHRVQVQATASASATAETREAMEALFHMSRRIEAIIGVIDELAAQTNILALNAGVESARAGDAGRGFAVVATEVRRLAQASAAAAHDIRSLITQATERIEVGRDRVQGIDDAVRGVARALEQVNAEVRSIELRCQSQAEQVGRVGGAVQSLDGMTQQNAALVEQAAAASAALRQQTERLFGTVNAYVAEAPADPAVRGIAATPRAARAGGASTTRRA